MTSNQIQVFSLTFIFNDLKSLLVLRNSCTDMYLLKVCKLTIKSVLDGDVHVELVELV